MGENERKETMTQPHKVHYIDSQWKGSDGPVFISYNPANGETVWKGPSADEHTVFEALTSSRAAFKDWANAPLEKRIGCLKEFQNQLLASKDILAEAISKETGKTLSEAKKEVQAMAGKVDISIDAYHERCKETKLNTPQGTLITRHKPHGIIAVFGPFNFPGHLPNGHIVPALLAGNTVIFKPSEFTPLVAEETMKCWEKARLPAGVINMVQGGRATGHVLAFSPDIDGLFFTGSWQTGKLFAEHFASFPEKILALEMGGNNPLIIHHSNDHAATANLTIQSAYLTTGQRCTCARRLIVPKGAMGDAFIQALAEQVGKIKIGPYTDIPEPFMGPLISEAAAQALLDEQKTLIAKEGKSLIEMRAGQPGTGFITPGLMDVTEVKDRGDKELFGPFLQIIRVLDLEEAIKEANHTAYGLSAGIVTDDPKAHELFIKNIRAGIVNWNTPLTGASSAAPFGGIGHSGNHRPSAFYAADYCSYPVASLETANVAPP